MTKTRHHTPCRQCGATHKNPMSSSLCTPCGEKEREDRLLREASEPVPLTLEERIAQLEEQMAELIRDRMSRDD